MQNYLIILLFQSIPSCKYIILVKGCLFCFLGDGCETGSVFSRAYFAFCAASVFFEKYAQITVVS